jgi:hypothetical protein
MIHVEKIFSATLVSCLIKPFYFFQVILVLFPNAESLEKVNELADVEDKLLLLVNAQWQSGQVS